MSASCVRPGTRLEAYTCPSLAWGMPGLRLEASINRLQPGRHVSPGGPITAFRLRGSILHRPACLASRPPCTGLNDKQKPAQDTTTNRSLHRTQAQTEACTGHNHKQNPPACPGRCLAVVLRETWGKSLRLFRLGPCGYLRHAESLRLGRGTHGAPSVSRHKRVRAHTQHTHTHTHTGADRRPVSSTTRAAAHRRCLHALHRNLLYAATCRANSLLYTATPGQRATAA